MRKFYFLQTESIQITLMRRCVSLRQNRYSIFPKNACHKIFTRQRQFPLTYLPKSAIINCANGENQLAKKLTYFPYFQKRKEYEHEQEARLTVDINPFVMDALNNQTVETGLPEICDIGMLFNIDVNMLIDEVIVSPYAKDWITETLRSVVQKFGFNFDVRPSTLLDAPTSGELIKDGGL